MTDRDPARRAERAARWYARLVRLDPAALRDAFGHQMLQTFRDHYRDAVEQRWQSALRFWVQVAGDASTSLVREHLAQQAGCDPSSTGAGFYQGHADDTDRIVHDLLGTWILALLVAGGMVAALWPVAGRLASRQRSLLATLREDGAGRGYVVGALALQALGPAGPALLVGGWLAVLLAHEATSLMLPGPTRPIVDTLVGTSPSPQVSLPGAIATLLVVFGAALVLSVRWRPDPRASRA